MPQPTEYKVNMNATDGDLYDLHLKLQNICSDVDGLFFDGKKLSVRCANTLSSAVLKSVTDFAASYTAPASTATAAEVTSTFYDNIMTPGSLSAGSVIGNFGSLSQLYFGTQTGSRIQTSTASITNSMWSGSISGNNVSFGNGQITNLSVGSNLNVTGALKSSVVNLPNSSFTGQYTDLSSLPWLSLFNNGMSLQNARMFIGTTSTDTSGVAKVALTDANTGANLFTKVLFAAATASTDTNVITSTYQCAIKKITTSAPANITFNVVSSQGLFARNNIDVYALVIGT